MRHWLLMGLLAMMLSGCGGDAANQVHIRIRNDSDRTITEFWLGAGGFGGGSRTFNEIPSGATSDYKSMEPELHNYRKYTFNTDDGGNYYDTVYPEQHLGATELTPGYYTFAYDIVDGQPRLTLIRDK